MTEGRTGADIIELAKIWRQECAHSRKRPGAHLLLKVTHRVATSFCISPPQYSSDGFLFGVGIFAAIACEISF
ncbi:MAG: hypothetical protein A2Z90_13900 [Burkholderiales bacterium GWA2_64_37]|nr:MAG: hypothetical protein A2Z90_13900 [Burkholderiales bacterium GWA2_64_37]